MSIHRQLGLFLAKFCLLFVVAAPLPAAADVFTISDVAVDSTAETAAAAREQAIAYGQSQAIQRLWQRLVPAERLSTIPSLSAGAVTDFVRDFSVANERTSAVRYIATLEVRFRPEQVRRFLRANTIAFAETVSKPVVVVPLFAEGNSLRLWDDPNPWRRVWLDRDGEHELVPLVSPLGDLGDIAQIDAARAEAGDGAALDALARRYSAGAVLVTTATLEGDADLGQARLRVVSKQYRAAADPIVRIDSHVQQQGEDLIGLLERAAQTIDAALQAQWRRDNLLRFDQQNRLAARVPLSGIDQWVAVRRRLDGSASVMQTDLHSLSRAEAEIEIVYLGTPEQLARTLAQSDLLLEPVDDPANPAGRQWSLRLAGAPAAAGRRALPAQLPDNQPQPAE